MKKYLAVFIMILICLHLPMQIRASQSEIGTTVPETHTVSIEAEHASAQYMEGDKGISDAYPVPRFSKPEFVERFLELSLFYGLSSPLNSEMICIFPYF